MTPKRTKKGERYMKMEKRKFRIGELAEHLNVERFVIRFWEKEFNFKAHRSHGGQRFYDEHDLQKFQAIKELLYTKKFTIAGAKQHLSINHPRAVKEAPKDSSSMMASQVTTFEQTQQPQQTISRELSQKLLKLRKALLTLQKML
jgi:DNA-binding transcriptional MerR regulator